MNEFEKLKNEKRSAQHKNVLKFIQFKCLMSFNELDQHVTPTVFALKQKSSDRIFKTMND